MRLGFRAKVLLSIALVTVVGILVVGVAYLRRSEIIVQENYTRSALGTLSVSMGTFEEHMQQAYNTVVALEYDDELNRLLQAYERSGRDIRTAREVSAYLQGAFSEQTLMEKIYAYLPGAKQVITSVSYNPVQEVFYPDHHGWLTEWPENRRPGLSPLLVLDELRPSPQHTLAFVRPVYDEEAQLTAVIAAEIGERKLFYQCLAAMSQNSAGTYYLLDKEDNIASAATAGHISTRITQLLDIPGGLPGKGHGAAVYNDLLVTSVASPMTGFHILGVTNRSHMLVELRNQQTFILLLLAATLLLVLALAVLMSRRVYAPIEKLRSAMDRISGGDLSARAEIVSKDEISQLGAGFNTMVDRIEALIGEVVEEQSRKKQAELDALQYQITPHFMYNTLNSIKFAALLQGADSIAEQLGAFIELLQASINRKGAFLTVGQEVRLVQNYVTLQKFRYMDRLTVAYDVRPGAEECTVPNLILQPLVENAVLHGAKGDGSRIHIRITAVCEDEVLSLTVEDDGKGMDEEQVRRLLTNPKKPKEGFSSIGISNITDRLELYYGGKAGLAITSRVGEGTRAVIHLPAAALPVQI